MTFRYCALTAVSSDQQATEEKDSLDYQLRAVRTYGDRMGGEFIDEYRADGFSRSGYWDFTRAMDDIPAFYQLATDARLHKFDVVLMESYDRLGDLGLMLFNYLSDQGAPYIQLRSVQQPLPIEDPSVYHPRLDDSTTMMLNQSLTINRYRTSKIYRGQRVGLPARAKAGKYAMAIPHGYIDTSTKEEYRIELDPVVTHLLQTLVAEYLKGASLEDCARIATASGVPSPRGGQWHRSRIAYIFANPFYAGKTFFGRTVREVELYDGKHPAMWDIETHEKLVQEMDRRGASLKNPHHYPLSDVLYCKNCEQQMYITRCLSRDKKSWYFYYRCLNKECRKKGSIRKEAAHEKIVDELTVAILNAPDVTVKPPAPVDNSKAINALERQLAKLKTTYETTELYSLEEFTEKARTINRQITELNDEALQREKAIRRSQDVQRARMEAREMLPRLDNYITTGAPKQVSNWLGKLCIAYCTHDKQIEVVLKE